MKKIILITIFIILAFLLCGSVAVAVQHNNEAINSDLSTNSNTNQDLNSNAIILTNSGSNQFSTQSNNIPQNDISPNDKKNITISGIVRYCLSGDLFPGVLITVSSIIGEELTKTITDSNGSYQLNFLNNETIFNVNASYPGHITSSKEVEVTPNTGNTEDLYGNADFRLGEPSADIQVDKWVCNN
ncbi:MAG: hypothetical protein B655_0787, partial [Methanobacterium sp. Maddingley MBC34]